MENTILLLHQKGLLTDDDLFYWQLLSSRRKERLLTVLHQRTAHVVVGMEAVDDGHNQAAILRSADAFGVQQVAVVVGKGDFQPSERVTQGAHKWLTIRHYADIRAAMDELRARGYRIWASRLDERAVPLPQVNLSQPAAFFFGNEHQGLSETALALADETFTIPMVGFVQSLNVSVAAAITLFHATRRARQELGPAYFLNEVEQARLLRHWIHISSPGTRRLWEHLENQE